MQKTYIGFIDGNIYIRNEKNEFLLQEKEIYTPLILEKIDVILKERPLTNISRVIFQALKEVFDIDSIFKSKSSNSIVPKNDELYDYFVEYIKQNHIFKAKLQNCQRRNIEIKATNDSNYLNNSTYLSYLQKKICTKKKDS